MHVKTTITFDQDEIIEAEKFIRHIELVTGESVPATVVAKLQSGKLEADKVITFTAAAAVAYRMFLQTMFDIGYELAIRLPLMKGYIEEFGKPGAMVETDLTAPQKHVA